MGPLLSASGDSPVSQRAPVSGKKSPGPRLNYASAWLAGCSLIACRVLFQESSSGIDRAVCAYGFCRIAL